MDKQQQRQYAKQGMRMVASHDQLVASMRDWMRTQNTEEIIRIWDLISQLAADEDADADDLRIIAMFAGGIFGQMLAQVVAERVNVPSPWGDDNDICA